MSAFGRKRTLDFAHFGAIERPLWRKADIPEYPQDFHKIDQLGTSAFRPEADIRLISGLTTAFDPQRTYRPVALQYKSWAELTDDRDLGHT